MEVHGGAGDLPRLLRGDPGWRCAGKDGAFAEGRAVRRDPGATGMLIYGLCSI